MTTKARVHSVYMGGMVDGPGIRYVLFMAGCMLRCVYCHNPDTWDVQSGTEMTVDEIMQDIGKYKSYMRFSGGGVTITGGEPFMQPVFLAELLQRCRAAGYHTALETSGYARTGTARAVLPHTDLVLLDVKTYNDDLHRTLTGASNARTLAMLHLCQELQRPTWVRYVLVPGLTDNLEDIKALAAFLRPFSCIEKIDVLPFHKTGEHKWVELGLDYTLAHTQPPAAELVQQAQEILGS